MAYMSRFFRVLPILISAGVVWLGLQACSSMQGQLAPELSTGEIVSRGLVSAPAALPDTSWRLLSFFGPE
jgi:hypothetical protein